MNNNSQVNDDREAFEASVTKLGIVASFEKHADGNYKNMQIQYLSAIWSEAIAQANVNEQSQAQQSQWISVEERLPEDNTYVLCSYKRFGEWLVHEGRYNEKGDFTITIIDAKVRYWMPLPPAPEGE